MKKLLIVVDMQNDFISGPLGSDQAKAILPNVKAKIEFFKSNGDIIIFTKDTHYSDYLDTQEGKWLPVPHCIEGTSGQEINSELNIFGSEVFYKQTFGSIELANRVFELSYELSEIELCGLCTDVCVISNAIILKAKLPEIKIAVDANCCAGISNNSHRAALDILKMCQIEVKNV